jgi:uncharacterized repeat protein (TIGR03803 family)
MNTRRGFTLRVSTFYFGIAAGALVILSLAGAVHTVRAQDASVEKVIFNFRPATGYVPSPVIARDAAGNIYGTTTLGESKSCGDGGGCGNIFKISPTRQHTILHTFVSKSTYDGVTANGVILDSSGNLYGTTSEGGYYTFGTVFELTSSGSFSNLHNFRGEETDGLGPEGVVVRDSAGNLYGTTSAGAGIGCGGGGCGVIYKVNSSGSETVLYSFTGNGEGANPEGSPILDAAGNLYGTAIFGGDLSCLPHLGYGCGTVWKLDTSRKLTVLYTFTGGTDGSAPAAGLIRDSSGNLYGTAVEGGDLSCYAPIGCGTAFKIDSSGNFTVLHTFTGGASDGQFPEGALFRDSSGNLYGTTYTGGDQSCALFDNPGCGVVYKLDTFGNETILHAFAGATTDGALTYATLISDGKGFLYGSTRYGGTFNGGVIFAVRMYY